MKVIGFANKFYTLWEKHQETRTAYVGYNKTQNYNVWVANYIKNISTDLETAKSLYPDAEINLELKGTYREWGNKPEYKPIPIEEYQFGKYAEMRIEDVDDFDYLRWYVNEANINSEAMEYAKAHLAKEYEKHGYKNIKGVWYEEGEYEEVLEKEEKRDELIRKAESGEPLEVVFESNFHYSYYKDESSVVNYTGSGEFYRISFVLEEGDYVERQYDGYCYYLPCVNGKGKRIKNKELVITEYKFEKCEDDEYTITIKKFEIKK